MTATDDATTEPKGTIRHLAESAWAWDLWVALAFAALVGVLWFTTDFSIGVGWATLATVVSGCFVLISWTLWHAVQALIIDTPYGDLLHSVDPKEDSARAPFMVMVTVGASSLALTSVLAVVVREDASRLGTGFILIPTALMVVWGFLGSSHVVYHYMTHRRFAASVQESLDQIEQLQAEAYEAYEASKAP